MIPLRNAAGDVQVHKLIPPGVSGDQGTYEFEPGLVAQRVDDADPGKAALESRQMLRPPKGPSGIGRDNFVNAIAEDETTVEDRYLRLPEGRKGAVEKDPGFGVRRSFDLHAYP